MIRALTAAALALVPSTASSASQGAPPSPVGVDPVRAAELQARQDVTGNVVAAHRANVAAEEAGRVVTLAVDEGVHVDAGALLAKLDSSQLELDAGVLVAQKASAEAVIDEREASLDLAKRELDSVEDLFSRKAATQNELDDARSEHAAALARLAQARSDVAVLDARILQIKDRIRRQEVRAPFAGVVASVATEAGEWLAVGAPVVELVSDETEAWLSVPQRHLQALRKRSGPIEVHVGDGSGDPLLVADWRLVPIVDPELRMLTVIAPLPAGAAAPGMSAEGWVPTAEKATYLTVSSAALLRNEVGPYLFVAMPGAEGAPQTALPVPVQVLWREGERAVVQAPPGGMLHDGASAIVEGNQRLFPGSPVTAVDPTGGSGGAGASGASGGAPKPGGDAKEPPAGGTAGEQG